MSDAFEDIASNFGITYKTLDMFSQKSMDLWEMACIKLIKLLVGYVGQNNIILVKNYLSEKIVNENGETIEFGNVEDISRINQLLKYKYDFFEKHAEGIIILETVNDEYYYTDQKFKHGCFPWHLNDREYSKIAEDLMRILRGDENL